MPPGGRRGWSGKGLTRKGRPELQRQRSEAQPEIGEGQNRAVERPVMQHEIARAVSPEDEACAAQTALQVKPVRRRHRGLPHYVGGAKGAEAGPVDGGGKDRRDIVGRPQPGPARSPAKGEQKRRGQIKFD